MFTSTDVTDDDGLPIELYCCTWFVSKIVCKDSKEFFFIKPSKRHKKDSGESIGLNKNNDNSIVGNDNDNGYTDMPEEVNII